MKNLKFALAVGAGLWAGVAGVVAQTAVTNGVPRIQFEALQHDFGRMPNGAVVKHTFVFTNTGNATLLVTHVQPSCGCTASGDWSREVAPGQTGTIPIQFNSGNFSGAVFKTVSVSCNDPAQPTVALQFKADIWKPIEVSPAFAVMNVPADAEAGGSVTVRIASNLPEPFQVFGPESNQKIFTADVVTNTPGKEYNLVIRALPPLTPGNTQGQISVRTSATNMPVLNVPVLAVVQPALVVSPGMLTLPAEPGAQPQTFNVLIRNQSARAITVTDVATSNPLVTVALKEVEPGRQFNLDVTFPPGFELAAGQTMEITARTSHPSHPTVRVGVNQFPRPQPPAAR